MWNSRPQGLPSLLAVSTFVLFALLSGSSYAAAPVVTAIPADANNAIIPHEIVSGRPTSLKAVVDADSVGADYSWDPGDGSAVITGTVTDPYAVWAEHTYNAGVGTVFVAVLTVDNGTDPPVSASYRMQVGSGVSALSNAAISEALWYMHRNLVRYDGDALGNPAVQDPIPMGYWTYPDEPSGTLSVSVTGASINAFEANGYRETGPASSPYSETVRRGLNYLFARLQAVDIVNQTFGSLDANPRDDDPDGNGNGLGITLDDRNINSIGTFDKPYQLGMVMDAVVASGTPNATTVSGPDNVIGRSYADVVQDMADWYAMGQSDSTDHGGWQYDPFNNTTGAHDNSASGWAATGIVAASDLFNATIPDWLIERNENGLAYTGNESDNNDIDGVHGYTNSPSPLWGAASVTGAAMVQMVMDGIESTTSATPDDRWVRAENWFRRHFDDNPDTAGNFKAYYYAMFNFTKAMRSATPSPVVTIGTRVGAAEGGVGCGPNAACAADGANPLDWYNDPTSGLAVTVSDYQRTSGAMMGSFIAKNYSSAQFKHNTPWATQILTRTLLQAGPIARANAFPNPGGPGFRTTFDPSDSFHQDPERMIVRYEWDFSDALQADDVADPDSCEVLDGTDPPPVVSPCVTDSPVLVRKPDGFICPDGVDECVQDIFLTVTDDGDPPLTSSTTVFLDLTLPPHAPTAVSGGPYVVCAGGDATLDGSNSFDLDEGLSEPGAAETDTITAYSWDVTVPVDFVDGIDGAVLVQQFDTPGVVDIGLRVTDNTANAYPSSGNPAVNLTGTDFTTVLVVDCFTADVGGTLSVDNDNPQVGEDVDGSYVVSNAGPDEATGLSVTGFIPDGVSIESVDIAGGACQVVDAQGGQAIKCDLDALAMGGTATIDFTIVGDEETDAEITFDIEGPDEWLDDDPSNNSASVLIQFISEIIVQVKSEGEGGPGSIGLIEILLLAIAAGGLLLIRRRRIVAGLCAVLLVAGMVTSGGPAQAEEATGVYAGFGYGNASVDFDDGDFTKGMANRGFTVTDVDTDDNDSAYKVYVGYLFNPYFGVEGAYVNLGQLDSSFSASIPPDQTDELLAAADQVQPGLGEGWSLSGLAQYPFGEHFAVYGTAGVFYAEPESKAKFVTGGTGTSSSNDSETKLTWGVGAKVMFGDGRWALRGAFERYDVGTDVDFVNVSIEYKFGWPKK